jgi:hypothetical protein
LPPPTWLPKTILKKALKNKEENSATHNNHIYPPFQLTPLPVSISIAHQSYPQIHSFKPKDLESLIPQANLIKTELLIFKRTFLGITIITTSLLFKK